MKKFTKNAEKYAILFCAAAFAVIAVSSAFASSLPAELGMWRLVSRHVTELTASEELGEWTHASYARSEPPARIDVQLTEGPGPGALFVPEGIVSSDDGPIGSSSSYETLNVGNRRAVLEWNGVTGYALAADIGESGAVTFEARGISKEELIAFAESMVQTLLDR